MSAALPPEAPRDQDPALGLEERLAKLLLEQARAAETLALEARRLVSACDKPDSRRFLVRGQTKVAASRPSAPVVPCSCTGDRCAAGRSDDVCRVTDPHTNGKAPSANGVAHEGATKAVTNVTGQERAS